MSDSHAAPAAPASDETAAKGKSGLMPKLLIGVFVGVVIAIECAAAYFLLPSPEEVSAAGTEDSEHKEVGDKHGEHGAGEHGDGHGEKHGDEHGDGHGVAEVELGEFSVTMLQPEAGMAYRVDFKIGATVEEKNKEKFTTLFAACQQRFRDQVMVEVRNCEITDLTDSGLGLIKRRISEKSNALFGEPLLQGVFFSEFSLVEQ
jgi:hypothetical protein